MYSHVHLCFYLNVRIYKYIYTHISGEVGASVLHAKTRLGCTREKAAHLFTQMLMLMMVLTVMMMMMIMMMVMMIMMMVMMMMVMMMMIPGWF